MSGNGRSLLLLHERSRPWLSCDAVVRAGAQSVSLETPDFRFDIDGADAGRLARILAALDGGRTIAQMAQEERVSPAAMIRSLEPLADVGALIDIAAPLDAAGDLEFLDRVMLECRLRTRALFQQPFWQRLCAGDLPPPVILGWGIEFAHFVESANAYMPLGIAACRAGPELREAFAAHYVEEALHSEFFFAGLGRCGLRRDRIEAAPPLASTRALINQLAEFAMLGAAPYAACFAVMQPSQEPADAGQITEFYQRLRDLYPFAAPLFDAFERHAKIDVELGHEVTLLERMCRTTGIGADARREVLHVILALVESFTLFFEGILDAYGTPGAAVPRRRVLIEI
jgi:pyrroloquinoline quinone (PQQ) biosynthesis protein C